MSDLEALKGITIPALFHEPSMIGNYGPGTSDLKVQAELERLMEQGSVTALAAQIERIVTKLADADPQTITVKPSWLERLVGKDVERQVRYHAARSTLDELLSQAEGIAQGVRDTLASVDKLLQAHSTEEAQLRIYIKAGREYLDENLQAGVALPGALEFDKPRERFARKLANLATLLQSHEISATQMKLTRAQAVDMLDRFSETTTVLVPVWRQHSLALVTTKSMSPALVKEATKAHQALVRSLAKSLDGS